MCLPICCREGRVEAVGGWASTNNDGTGEVYSVDIVYIDTYSARLLP